MKPETDNRRGVHAARVEADVRAACLAELAAMKPGNVSVHSNGHGMVVEDFERSAQAVAPLLAMPGASVGERILGAVDATRGAAGCNTNLGIVLLCAPLAHAALSARPGESLRSALSVTLADLDERDTELVYRAIRLARPGGMGVVEQHDISEVKPQVGLLEAMASAAGRDSIARQYTNGYAEVFELAVPRLRAAARRWNSEEWAIVSTYLELLAELGDSLVERKHGAYVVEALRRDARQLGALLEVFDEPCRAMAHLRRFDAALKRRGINPGTTADLTVAALLAVRLDDDLQITGLVPVPGRGAGSGCRFPPFSSIVT